MQADDRRDLACRSARVVADQWGIAVHEPTIIKDSNNTIVGLNDDVVAKVATPSLGGRNTALDRELAVLCHVAASPAPVGRLSTCAAPDVHEALGCRMILLERLEQTTDELDPPTVLQAIADVHAALITLAGIRLPSFLDNLDAATATFADPTRSPTLPDDERTFCRRVAENLGSWFADRDWDDIVLHGDPWLHGNLITTTVGPRLIDFEAACVGPREWDLSPIGAIADTATDLDRNLLDQCRALRSYTVSASCWAQPGRATEVDQAARWHLELLHRFQPPR